MSFTYEEAFKETLAYFDGDDLATKCWIDKYCLKDNEDNILEKSPTDMHWRIAKEFARIEKSKFKRPLSEPEIFGLLDHFKYIVPQGSPMFGIGNNYQTVSLSNCYLATPPLDSYSSILDTDKELVNISKRRGGVGINLDNLRPKGTITKNSAKTSTGIVSWMERYSNSIREVGQNNRRGALMLTLSIHHPDIIDFCTIKNDPTKVVGANISVKLTREFLEAVKSDSEYELRFPTDSKTPQISKKVKAKDVWKTIIHSAWLRAEPGLLMWDNVTEQTPADCYNNYKSQGCNPCQPNWAKVLTKEGIRQLDDIDIGTEIWSQEGWTKVVNKFSTGVKKVYKYITTAGVFYGTSNHQIIQNGNKIEVNQAKAIDIISGPYENIKGHDKQVVMDGLVLGDGSIHKASGNLVHLHIGKDDYDYFTDDIKSLIGKHRPGLSDTAYEVSTHIQDTELPPTYQRSIPNRYIYANYRTKCSFLRGLYSANGSVCGNRITLKSSSFKIIEDTQLILSSIGIRSYWTKNKATNVKFKNGTFLCKESYDLNITSNRDLFIQNIGFIQKYKNDKIKYAKSIKTKTTFKIISTDEISTEEVLDITVDNNSHTYWTQGCNVSNCSEISLSPLDSCRLLVLNLYSYVTNPFTKDSSFDYELFFRHSRIAQRLMDDLVDLESEKITAIIEKIKSDPEPKNVKQPELDMWYKIKKFNDEGRRTGTGIVGLGDALAALNIKYGSEESIIETGRIYKTLKLGCYRASVDMAKELGPFKEYDSTKEEGCEFIQNIKTEDEYLFKDMLKYGRRNIALTTSAPTGTVSIMTQTTSGIEPLFMMGYTRRKKICHNDTHSKIHFTDTSGDKWEEFTVYHPKIKEWMKITGKTDISKSPWCGCCAEEIDWTNRVKLQAAAGKHVCHSISSTINLPENVSEEEVATIYQTSFETGLKGITVYRKNCRSGVLVDNKKNIIEQHHAPERPKDLKCHINHCTVDGKRFFVLVGLYGDNNQPYEIFAGRGSLIDEKIRHGLIRKMKTSFYKGILEDETELSPITLGCSDNQETITRLVSLSMRHGVPIEFILEQLSKVEGSLNDFSRAIIKTLKKHMKDGTKTGESCPSCNAKLVFSEGCQKCMNCSYSKC